MTLMTTPYGQFVQHLQRGNLDQLVWNTQRQHAVEMPHTHTNIVVTANETFDRFTLASQQNRWSNALAGQAMDMVRNYTGRHQIPDAQFTSTQLGHVLKEISTMKVNKLAKQRQTTPVTTSVAHAQPTALPTGHYEARDIIGLLRTGHLESQHPWVTHGAMQRLTVEMHQPAWQVRLEKYVTHGKKHTDPDAISYGIVPTARTRASAADPAAYDQLFNLIGRYYNDLRTSTALDNGHLTDKQAASLLTMIESASREQQLGRGAA